MSYTLVANQFNPDYETWIRDSTGIMFGSVKADTNASKGGFWWQMFDIRHGKWTDPCWVDGDFTEAVHQCVAAYVARRMDT